MKFILPIICLALSFNSMAQSSTTQHPLVFSYVEQMPTPTVDINSYIAQNIVYPPYAEKNNIEGRVILKYVIDSTGKIADLHVFKSVDASLDSEAVRVVRSMPNWIPGHQNGKAVRVFMTQPIDFNLTDRKR
ncbi:MAG: energy transducer TonB [Flavipsychrobacter sp.]